MKSHWIQVALIQYDCYPSKKGEETQTWTQRAQHVKMEAAITVMCLQTEERQGFLGNNLKLGERQGTDPPSEPPEVTNPDDTWVLDFWLPELQENKCPWL